MTKRSLGALIVLNLVLLIGLAVVSVPDSAHAQLRGNRDYLMIAGEVTGRRNQNAVYITELNSARMIALFFNASNKKVQYMAARSLTEDMGASGRR